MARRSASLRRCDLAGLAAGPHEVTVTACDAAGEWSGAAATDGALTTTVTPSVVAPDGAEAGCQPVYETTHLDVGAGMTWYVDISDDARFVAFSSPSSNLVAGDTNEVWNRATGERIVIGRYYPGSTGCLRASDDGGVVVYQTNRVWRWDRATGVSTALTSEVGYWPVPSSDGRFVVFEGSPVELAGVPRPGTYLNLAVYDAATGSTSWAGPSGGPYHRMTADASVIVTADWKDEGIGILRRIG